MGERLFGDFEDFGDFTPFGALGERRVFLEECVLWVCVKGCGGSGWDLRGVVVISLLTFCPFLTTGIIWQRVCLRVVTTMQCLKVSDLY